MRSVKSLTARDIAVGWWLEGCGQDCPMVMASKEGSWKRGATVEFSVATDPRINTDYIFRYHCYCYSYSIPCLRGRVEWEGAGLWPRGQAPALHQTDDGQEGGETTSRSNNPFLQRQLGRM